MRLLAIDPGNERSAYVLYDNKIIEDKGILDNNKMLEFLYDSKLLNTDRLYIEMIASYGMAVGKTVFDTCVWIGRFIEAWNVYSPHHQFIYRKDVKMHLCKSTRAKDSNVRQAIIDLYGGDKAIAIGTKKNQGPLYGVKKDIWAALAVAITAHSEI